ncbi:MAG: hypothetical protein WCJ37_02270 [Syntrophus sp. (in: bacteria)]
MDLPDIGTDDAEPAVDGLDYISAAAVEIDMGYRRQTKHVDGRTSRRRLFLGWKGLKPRYFKVRLLSQASGLQCGLSQPAGDQDKEPFGVYGCLAN